MDKSNTPMLPFEDEPIESFTIDTFYEVNLLRFPLCFLDKKKKGSTSVIDMPIITAGGRGRWIVSPNATYGSAGPLEDSILMALSKLISDMPKPIKNPVGIGSFENFCKIMGTVKSMTPKIKEGFRRLAGLLCMSDLAFFNKEAGVYLQGVEGTFHIIEKVVFANERLEDGTLSETNYVWLSDSLLRNLNAGYACPLDSQFYFELSTPTARALLKRFIPRFYASAEKPWVRSKYTTLCYQLPLTPLKHKSRAEQQFQAGMAELQGKGIVKKYEFLDIPGVKRDWYIVVWKGDRWQRYYKTLPTEQYRPVLTDESNQSKLISFSDQTDNTDSMRRELVTLGIDKRSATFLVNKFGHEKIKYAISKYKILLRTKPGEMNPGYLRQTIVKADIEELKSYVEREKNKDDKAKRKADEERRSELRTHLKDIYLEYRSREVMLALDAMNKKERDELNKKAKGKVTLCGIEPIDHANVQAELEIIVAAKIGFPSEQEWLSQQPEGDLPDVIV